MRTHRFLLVNPSSGDGSPGVDELVAEAARRDVETHVLRDGEEPAELARASGAAVLGIAGGDGSLAAVAQAALDTGAGFVCVPFGTRNHFARDVGLDRDDPLGALAAFDDGAVERQVDVGRIGDRLFLNNVSLGVYAGLVHRREHHRRRDEALARLRGLAAVARHRHRLRASVNGEPLLARVLLVGNNRYDLSLFTLGERDALDEGELHLFAAAGVLPTAWEERVGRSFRIDLPQRRVRVAIDGEPETLDPPLELTSLPRALRVLLPATSAGTRDEGGAMHDNPRASDDEQEQAHEGGRQQEEESMRYPEHHDPDTQQDRAHRESEE